MPSAWRTAGSRCSGPDPLTDQPAKLGVRTRIAQAGLRDEPPHMAASLVEEEDQPLGFAYARQYRPRQADGRPVRRRPGHAIALELVLVYATQPQAGRERPVGLRPGRQPPHTQRAPADQQRAQTD